MLRIDFVNITGGKKHKGPGQRDKHPLHLLGPWTEWRCEEGLTSFSQWVWSWCEGGRWKGNGLGHTSLPPSHFST